MNTQKIIYGISFCAALSLWGCSTEPAGETHPDLMAFEVLHPAQTRATASNFENGDSIGVYVTGHRLPLEVSGNYVNNARLRFDGQAWKTERSIYWNDGTYDVYAYYPYTDSPAAVDDLPFRVAADQSTHRPGGYEASDFLWASHAAATAGNGPVSLAFKHRMSKLDIRLIPGEDFEGKLPEDARVFVHNTVPSATIDLSVGIVTKDPYGTTATIEARNMGNYQYSAILVPQRLSNRLPLVEVVMKGVSYLVESTFVFKAGVQHTVSVIIAKNPEQVKIEIGGEIENWD